MKIFTQLKTVVEGDSVTITAKLVDGQIRGLPMIQNTILHHDEKNARHIAHVQVSNHGLFVKLPNTPHGVVVPLEDFVMSVARVVEPKLCPKCKPESDKK